MKRKAYSELLKWKNSKNRKPLVLQGARQVGKTWLLREFGAKEFDNFAYFNCDNNEQLKTLFYDYDIERIIRGLSAISNEHIEPEKTLIVFDEIQEIPQVLTSLKYFYEKAPGFYVAVAGSLLGLHIHEGTGFPVGCVSTLKIYPLSFMEFVVACGNEELAKEIERHDWMSLNVFLPKITDLVRQYYYVGGMPEVVSLYVETKNLIEVRRLQSEILNAYAEDISKHAPKNDLAKIGMVWRSIPSQLTKENKKFIYGAIKTGGRAKEFENAIQWLIDAGLVHKVSRVKKLDMPLNFYEDFSAFKLFLNDIGLLVAMTETSAANILVGNDGFSCFKGSLTEQYVFQQCLNALKTKPYYYSNDSSSLEIDFVMQTETIYPIEVKAEENLKSKSLSTVLKNNANLFGIRFSMAGYREQEKMVNVPLGLTQEYLYSLSAIKTSTP